MSIGKALFVYGFTDVSVGFEHSGFLALAVEVGSSDSRWPKKDRKGTRGCGKKRKKLVVRRGFGCDGVRCAGSLILDCAKSKGEGGEGKEGGGVGAGEAPSTTP